MRQRLKPALKSAMSGLAQFGFVPGRGTEEAICKALTHVDEARQRAAASRKIPGRGHGGLKLRGSLTLSVDMSKAFDTVDRVRLREALEAANADPFLVEVVGMLHIEALYDMTASETKFSVATKRGIKQGCKLAPSLFAFVTGLLYRKLANQITQDELARLLTMYADDILLQSHFDSFDALTRALGRCDLLLDQLTALGFRVNPTKSALLLQLHGGSAVTARKMLIRKVAGEKFVTLPSGRLISHKTQVPYLGKATRPQRDFPVAQWREGSRHFPLMGQIRHCRTYSAQVPKRYDQQRMEDCYRRDRTSIEAYCQQVEQSLESTVRSWKAIRESMASALEHHFPRQRRGTPLPTSANWEHRRSLRSLPTTLQALSDMHSELDQAENSAQMLEVLNNPR